MSTGQGAASRRWLLPHERWFNRFFVKYSMDPPLPQQVRLRQNYGPDGMTLFAAAACDGLAGAVLGISGVLLASIAQRGMPATTGYWLAGTGVLSGVLGIIRTLQMASAGRAFRAAGRSSGRDSRCVKTSGAEGHTGMIGCSHQLLRYQ